MADEQPDLAGYQDVNQLVAGYRASGAEAKRLAERNAQLEQQVQFQQQQMAERQAPPQRGAPEDRLRDFAVPVDALDELIQQRISAAFTPLIGAYTARGQVMAEHPDFSKYESEVYAFVNRDPNLSQRYQRMMATDPQGATEYAYLKFGEARRREAPQVPVNGNEAAMAQVPNNRVADTRTQPSDDEEFKQKAWEYYQQTKDPRAADAYGRMRLREAITDQMLGLG